MTPRRLTEADLPAAVSLLDRVGLAGGAANLARYLRWQADGGWAIDHEDQLAGIVTVLRHGEVGFVGCMAVEPALQGRGIGRRVLEHAQLAARRAGATTFLLEATPSGAQLYRRLGYVEDHESLVLGRAATGSSDAALLAPADRAAILELDRAATATPRDAMIGGLVDEAPGAVARARGELAGYGLIVGERLGPVIAREPSAGRALIDRLAPACTSACVPVPNAAALAALAANGFVEQRRLWRMRLGAPVPSRVGWIWTLASPGAG